MNAAIGQSLIAWHHLERCDGAVDLEAMRDDVIGCAARHSRANVVEQSAQNSWMFGSRRRERWSMDIDQDVEVRIKSRREKLMTGQEGAGCRCRFVSLPSRAAAVASRHVRAPMPIFSEIASK